MFEDEALAGQQFARCDCSYPPRATATVGVEKRVQKKEKNKKKHAAKEVARELQIKKPTSPVYFNILFL